MYWFSIRALEDDRLGIVLGAGYRLGKHPGFAPGLSGCDESVQLDRVQEIPQADPADADSLRDLGR